MPRRTRLLVIPALLFAFVAGTVFVLAELHSAKPETGSAPLGPPMVGDLARGRTLFAENCSGCHGEGGAGGGVGPTLAGSGISRAEAQAKIQSGGGVMPAGLVEGQELADVLAYLETIVR
jgi:mono/diheme cytochrome c family protein